MKFALKYHIGCFYGIWLSLNVLGNNDGFRDLDYGYKGTRALHKKMKHLWFKNYEQGLQSLNMPSLWAMSPSSGITCTSR
jgi:hypothetical protein